MAAIQYGVTALGFVRKPLTTIIDSLNSKFQAAFGSTFDVSPESPDGQIIGIISDEIDQCWSQAQQAFNAYRPGAVEGVGLDNVCELTNTKRYVDKHSEVTVVLTGSEGALVPAGSQVGDDAGMTFTIQTDTLIPGDATAVADQSGEYYVGINTVTKIVTQGVAGWTGVNNPDIGVTGILYESDPAFRARRDRTTAVSGSATAEAIYAALADLNLTYIRIRDNDTGAAIGSQPAGTIFVVVDGGTKNDIGRRIYKAKTGGVPTYGTEEVTITDTKGYEHLIKFSRSSKQDVFVTGTFKRRTGANISSNDAAIQLRDATVAYLNSLSPGESVVWSKMFKPLMDATKNIEVDSLFIGLAANPTGTSTIDMDIDKSANGVAANISFTDVTTTP